MIRIPDNTLHIISFNFSYEEVVRDKEALAKELASCQKNLKAIGKGTISKELSILKKVVQNLEV